MPIKDLSSIRRLPRLGKIQLGIKVKTNTPCKCRQKAADKNPLKDCMLCKGTGLIHRPKEVDYFVLPKALQEFYPGEPKELPIMFPIENAEVFFQQWYKCYGFNVLKCKGDGVNAMTWDEEKQGMVTIACPCEKRDTGLCRRVAILQFLLPDVPGAGVWQISTTSRNSIIDINSSVSYIRQICGRVRMIPLVLKREPIKTQRLEKGVAKSGTHYTLKIDMANISLRQLQAAGQVKPEESMLPAPDEAREDLLYPVAGFNGQAAEAEGKAKTGVDPTDPKQNPFEKEKTTERTEPTPQESMRDALKLELTMIMGQYHDFGGKLTQGEEDGLLALETQMDYKQAILKYGPKRDVLQAVAEQAKKKPAEKPKEERADTGEELGIDRDGNPIDEEPPLPDPPPDLDEREAKKGRGGPPDDLYEGKE